MINFKQSNNPVFAVSCLLQGFKLLTHKELRHYVLIPLLINAVIYSGVFILGYYTATNLIHGLIPEWLSWLSWILWPLFYISYFVVAFFTFSLLANLIGSPYYSRIASKTQQILTGVVEKEIAQAWDKVFIGELKRIAYLLLRSIPLLILFMIPVVNLLAPILWAIFASWGIAMEFMAYPLENKGMLFPEQKQFMRKSGIGMLSFGGSIGFGMTLPIINLVIAQAAVIGSTIYVHHVSNIK